MFVLKRVSKGSGYVARSGHKSSYARNLRYAQKFATRELAEASRCVESEVVVDLDRLLIDLEQVIQEIRSPVNN